MQYIKIVLKEKKEKSNNMVVNVTKISQGIKWFKDKLVQCRKNIIERGKYLIIIIRKVF